MVKGWETSENCSNVKVYTALLGRVEANIKPENM
jgi:hypothetical protein